MAVTAQPHAEPRSIFARPTARDGLAGWLTTIDHKKIGILYFVTSFVFFIVGGLEALLIRVQLAQPEQQLISADLYNQIFTMHGLTMIFFVVMPMSAAFFNYLTPLMIGARDVAFPRLNAFSYWVFLAAGIYIYSLYFLGGLPDGGWTGYGPLHSVGPDPSGETIAGWNRMLGYSLGLQIAGIASLVASINFVVTILNLRAPGLTLMRLPVFIWMTLVVNFLILFAMPVIGVALWQLMFDTQFGANFFNPAAGADPVLWQHLFWLFGHPEVYILILPAFGIVSEVLPVFSRKPLFGYAAVVFSGIAIGFMGWGVWAHHMFAVGLGPVANTAFALTTMFIAVPTGIKIFNWMGTMWMGRLRFRVPMLFAIGLVAMFTIGGLSGVTHAVVPHNLQQHDTYYVVAHFHYVLFGGALFGLFSGIYFWYPKVYGHFLGEGLGKLHFWLMLIGFNLTFGPMHILGLTGMPRRIDTYPDGFGWGFWNLVATVGAFTIALSVLVFMANVVISRIQRLPAGNDPWDARTLEWLTPSPPPMHNFDEIPHVTARDETWHRKYHAGEAGEPIRVPAGAAEPPEQATDVEPPRQTSDAEPPEDRDAVAAHGIHLPDPSYYPLVAAIGLPVMAYGVMFTPILIGLGGLIVMAGLFGWSLEPSVESHDSRSAEEHH
jgi:cytochrome c oxidase subunit I